MTFQSEIEFGHDGYRDSLTGADSPTVFYRNLIRALGSRRRNGGTLYILTVKVIEPSKKLKPGSAAKEKQIKEYESELIKANQLIKRNLRAGDFYTRMAVDGYYILINGEASEEVKLIERFKKIFADRALYSFSSHKLSGDLNPVDWLNQIDSSYFLTT